MIEIRTASPEEVKAFCGTIPHGMREAWGAFEGNEILGVVIILRDPLYAGSIFEDESDWYVLFDMPEVPEGVGFRILMTIGQEIRRFDFPLYAWHDDRFPTAEKFLRLFGFKPTERRRESWKVAGRKMRIWKRWQGSAQS